MPNNKTSKPIPDKIRTRIWTDTKQDNQPVSLCHGYDFYNDLLGRYSWPELCYLLIKGELPNDAHRDVFNLALSCVINPGPQHWSTQAAMSTAVTHTTVGNSLIAGLSVLQGRFDGALAVEASMRMLSDGAEKQAILDDLISRYPDMPGYGLPHGKPDPKPTGIINTLKNFSYDKSYLLYAQDLEQQYASKPEPLYLTLAGLFATLMLDLNFSPAQGHGLYLLAATPGLLAHALEQQEGDWSTYPFYKAPDYNGPSNKKPDDNQKIYQQESS